MSEDYAQVIRESLPNAQLVYDRFHVQQLASKAVEPERVLWRVSEGSEPDFALDLITHQHGVARRSLPPSAASNRLSRRYVRSVQDHAPGRVGPGAFVAN